MLYFLKRQLRPVRVSVQLRQLQMVVRYLGLHLLRKKQVCFGGLPGGILQLVPAEEVGGDPACYRAHSADAGVESAHEVSRLRVLRGEVQHRLEFLVAFGGHSDLGPAALLVRSATEYHGQGEPTTGVVLVALRGGTGVGLGVLQHLLRQIVVHVGVGCLHENPNRVGDALDDPGGRLPRGLGSLG